MRAPTLRLLYPLIAVAMLSTAVVAGTTGTAQAAVTNDGTTQSTAAASCWEAKQVDSEAADGIYWILTPQLQVPTQIYCDMTTDGGGWALVGRGRDGWSWAYNGKGTSEQVASTVTGQAAFSPRQLDAVVINGLLGGKRFDDPTFGGGVRIVRSTNQAGTTSQDVRFNYRAGSRDRWTWAFGAGLPIPSVNIDGSTINNTTTFEFGADSAFKRLWTYGNVKNNYIRGFHFGQNAIGTTAADSYLYSSAAGGRYATPFTQVFIRPKIRTSDVSFAPVPDSGTAEQTIRKAPRNGSMTSTWGVTGIGAAGGGENSTETQAFAQMGNTMYVGGNFTTVQKGAAATGEDKVAQPYLAAFDATTGDFIRTFKPSLNSQVKTLQVLPNGKLAVGGEFTQVGGAAHVGLVIIDPTTGALDPAWTTNLQNRTTSGKVSVRGLDTDGTYLYLTGAFTHFVKGASTVYAKNGARIRLSTGAADSNWNPEFNGTGTGIDVSDDNTRVYFSGYFTTARGGTVADRGAAFTTEPGAPRVTPTWQPTFSTNGSARYQQAIKQVGNKVWLGGSQHSMFSYDTSTFALVDKHISKAGGDVQAIDKGNGLVFGGCHCENWNYSNTTAYDSTSPGSTNITWDQADTTDFIGAWDPVTGLYVPEFTPTMKARSGMGVWALKVADDGTLWAGGSLVSSVKENGSNQWVGGFVRYAVRPHTAPDAPSKTKVLIDGADAKVSWSASSTSGVSYEVLRNDRVVATSSTTDVTIPGAKSSDKYFVRAVDSWSNRSVSTSAETGTVAPVTTTLLPAESTWSYYFDSSALPVSWKQAFYDDSTWKTGAAALGWGAGSGIATNIDVPANQTRPSIVSYYRKKFTIAPGSTFGEVTLTTRADDGVAVYVNGTEVGRSNLPDGTLSTSSYALSAPSTASAVGSPVTFTVPVSALKIGDNTVAVEVHSHYRATPSSSMDASISATAGASAPAAPSTTTALVANGQTWSYYFDNTAPVASDWQTSEDATASWSTGPASLGWGTSRPIATNIDVPDGQTRALTSYFRKSFMVADAGAVTKLTLRARADDGVAIYINGVEAKRANLPDGALTAGTYALSGPSTATAIANEQTWEIPTSLLQTGTNSIAVEVHSNYRATPNTSMDLRLIATS